MVSINKDWKFRFISFALSLSLSGNVIVPSFQVFAEQTTEINSDNTDENTKESKVVESATSSGSTEGNVLDTSTAGACSGGVNLSGIDAEVFESVKAGLNLTSTTSALDDVGSSQTITRELTCAQSNGFHTEVSGDSAIQDTHWTVWFKNSKDDEIDKTQDTGNYHGFPSNKVNAWLPYSDTLKTINDGNVPESRHYEYPTDTEGTDPLEFWTDIPGYYDVLGDPRYSGIQIDSYQHFSWNVEITTETVRFEVNQEATEKMMEALLESDNLGGAGGSGSSGGGVVLNTSVPKTPASSSSKTNKNNTGTTKEPNIFTKVLQYAKEHPVIAGLGALALGAGLFYAGASLAGYAGGSAVLKLLSAVKVGSALKAGGAASIVAGDYLIASGVRNKYGNNPQASEPLVNIPNNSGTPSSGNIKVSNPKNALNLMGDVGHGITQELQGETAYDKAQKADSDRIANNAGANSYMAGMAGRAEISSNTTQDVIEDTVYDITTSVEVDEEPGSTTVHVASANVGDNAYATEIAAYKKLVLAPGKNGDIPYSVEDSPFWGSVKPSYWKDGGIYTVHNDSSLPYHFEAESESTPQDTNTVNVYANIVKTADKFFTTINGYADITQVPGINKRGTYPKGEPKACIEVDGKETCSSDKSPLVRVKLDLSDPDAQKQVEAEKFVHLTEYYDPDEEEGEISTGTDGIVDKTIGDEEE